MSLPLKGPVSEDLTEPVALGLYSPPGTAPEVSHSFGNLWAEDLFFNVSCMN